MNLSVWQIQPSPYLYARHSRIAEMLEYNLDVIS